MFKFSIGVLFSAPPPPQASAPSRRRRVTRRTEGVLDPSPLHTPFFLDTFSEPPSPPFFLHNLPSFGGFCPGAVLGARTVPTTRNTLCFPLWCFLPNHGNPLLVLLVCSLPSKLPQPCPGRGETARVALPPLSLTELNGRHSSFSTRLFFLLPCKPPAIWVGVVPHYEPHALTAWPFRPFPGDLSISPVTPSHIRWR